MEKQSVKKARLIDIGDNIIIPIPVIYKRSPFDPPTWQDGYYKIGTSAGTLDRRYLSTEVELSQSIFLQDVPEVTVSKNRLYCSCTS